MFLTSGWKIYLQHFLAVTVCHHRKAPHGFCICQSLQMSHRILSKMHGKQRQKLLWDIDSPLEAVMPFKSQKWTTDSMKMRYTVHLLLSVSIKILKHDRLGKKLEKLFVTVHQLADTLLRGKKWLKRRRPWSLFSHCFFPRTYQLYKELLTLSSWTPCIIDKYISGLSLLSLQHKVNKLLSVGGWRL